MPSTNLDCQDLINHADRQTMNKTQKKNSKAETIVVFLFLMLLFGGCVRQMGSPWNCDEASSNLQSAKDEYNESLTTLTRSYDPDNTAWAQVKANKLVDARAKVLKLCRSK